MQENQHLETQLTENSDDPLQSPEYPHATFAGSDDDRTRQLQAWLDLLSVRGQRGYLEHHCELLDEQSETILRELLTQAREGSEQTKQVHDALMLLQEASRRGGKEEAIRETYVNVYGGFALDVPDWLAVVEQQLIDMLEAGQRHHTIEARTKLLQDVLEHMEGNNSFPPEIFASLQRELAIVLSEYPQSARAQTFEVTVSRFNKVLQVYTVTRYPRQYAETEHALGNAYRDSANKDRKENLEHAILCYHEALRVFTSESFPYDYAKVLNNLSIAYWYRIAEKRSENLEHAIACCHEALGVLTLESFPYDYARVLNTLGIIYWDRIEGERRENLEQAIACFHEALGVFTLDAFPQEYAKVQNNLGIGYRNRVEGEKKENLKQAIIYYHEALQVWTLQASPYDYARTQHNLGAVYSVRSDEERRENLEQAIACYHEALRVWTLESFPYDYAKTQDNLGVAYRLRIEGEKKENLEKAVACFREALRVHTLEAFPYAYAKTNSNLGKALGARQETLEQAIVCFHEALLVYSLETFPRDFRNAQSQIAMLQAKRGNWAAVREAYIAALEAEDLLIALGAGIPGRDAILREGHDAAIRLGYVLVRLDHTDQALVAMERGRARGLAEAMAFDAADPALITDEERRSRYTSARAVLIAAQADLHAPISQGLDDDARRRLDLERTATYRQAKATFDKLVMEIRNAHDPADFMGDSLDAATILHIAERVGPGHALVYLAATPWGGVAVAALSARVQKSSIARFTALNLPGLTEAWVNALIETRLQDGSERLIGGFAFAQMGESFERLQQQWNGETLQTKAKALHAACRKTKQESTLDCAAQETMRRRPLTRLSKQPLSSLSRTHESELRNTLDQIVLQLELAHCLEQLSATLMHPLIAWLHEQGATSLTLIPCGYLATFPLATVVLPDGRSVSETLPTSIAPSARSLLHTANTRDIKAGAYALGDPRHNLPWSEAEALTLTALARRFALPAEAHVKQQATRERLLSALGNRWIVDASCHGDFNQKDFLQSALLLAQKGHITMSEMLSHRVDLRGLRLLLLSACQTALLDLQGAPDEVHSLAAAMLQAGAQAVLAAQWAVDDKATYLLMVRFAQEWLPHMEQESPAAALARAQAWLRSVTNAELAAWHSTMPTPARMKPLMKTASKRRQTGQTTTRKLAPRWERIAVRGRHVRYLEDEAQLAVRIGAEEDNPSARPFADPYFWAGFQVIGW